MRKKIILVSACLLSLFYFLPRVSAQLGTESVTVISPNGGECLIPGAEVTVTWSGTGYEHVALGYRTDANQPPTWQSDFQAWNAHPVFGTSFKWTVPNITSNSVRLWIEAHNASHARLALDSSNNVFTISNTCGVDQPPSTSAPQIKQILVKSITYKPSDTIEVPKGTDLTVVGTAGASEAISLYVGANKKFSVTAGADGNWTFDIFTTNLTEGPYQVDLETSSSPRANAFSFTVIPLGQAPSLPPPTTTAPPPSQNDTDSSVKRSTAPFPYLTVGIAAAVALLGGMVTYIILRRQSKRIDRTPPTQPPTIT